MSVLLAKLPTPTMDHLGEAGLSLHTKEEVRILATKFCHIICSRLKVC